MKVIILAGGWGTRLGQQSQDIPKPMVPIGKLPILWHIMKYYSHYGYNDFIISLGVRAHVIKNFFYNYEVLTNDFTIDLATKQIEFHRQSNENRWRITLIDTGQDTLKGARIKRVEEYLDSDINMVTYGDGLADVDIKRLIEFHESHGKTLTVTGVHPPARFGEIIEEKNLVTSFHEKLQTSTGLINGGFMVFNRSLLDYLTEDENCDLETGPMELLAKKSEIMVFKHKGYWECMDHERDVEHLNRLWNENRAFWRVWE